MHDFPITKDWILAGHAIFTVFWPGQHYTYKIIKKEANGRFPDTYFVNLLTGPDNSSDYTYLGLLVDTPPRVKLTRASKHNEDSLPVKALNRALTRVWAGQDFPPETGIKGMGRCGRCGHELTHPDGVSDEGYRLGYGPVCWEKM